MTIISYTNNLSIVIHFTDGEVEGDIPEGWRFGKTVKYKPESKKNELTTEAGEELPPIPDVIVVPDSDEKVENPEEEGTQTFDSSVEITASKEDVTAEVVGKEEISESPDNLPKKESPKEDEKKEVIVSLDDGDGRIFTIKVEGDKSVMPIKVDHSKKIVQ